MFGFSLPLLGIVEESAGTSAIHHWFWHAVGELGRSTCGVESQCFEARQIPLLLGSNFLVAPSIMQSIFLDVKYANKKLL